jgi:hypothetical protein
MIMNDEISKIWNEVVWGAEGNTVIPASEYPFDSAEI